MRVINITRSLSPSLARARHLILYIILIFRLIMYFISRRRICAVQVLCPFQLKKISLE